jgi:hypothetical protein
MPEMKLKVDPELEAYLPALEEDVFRGVEDDIIRNGCEQSIKTWHGFIVDGHNRYRICLKHGIPFRVEEIDTTKYKEKLHVRIWMSRNQLSKGRVLSMDERIRESIRLIEQTVEAGWEVSAFLKEQAEALGVSERTLHRKLAKERAIKRVDPEVQDKLPAEKLEALSYDAVKSFTSMSKAEQEDVIDRTGGDAKAISDEMARRRKPKPEVPNPVVGETRDEDTTPTPVDAKRAAAREPTKLGQDAMHQLGELNKRVMALKPHLRPVEYKTLRSHMVQIDELLVAFVQEKMESQGVVF